MSIPRIVVAVDPPRGASLAAELADEGATVLAVTEATACATGMPLPSGADVLVLTATRQALTARVVADCDQHGVRIVPLGDDESARRLADAFGLPAPLPAACEGWVLLEALSAPLPMPPSPEPAPSGRVVAVWGPHGAPGRTTLAIEIAAELSRAGARVALVDADAHAPSVALALGVADEGPGFAAACRQAELGGLDGAELTRISTPVSVAGGVIDVLPGINRPSRWPELREERVAAALAACRPWAEHVVVDVAASLEAEEEIMSDIAAPRRNAATLASLRAADLVVAVCAADPVGVARFLRGFAELRVVVGSTRIVVVVNRLRAGTVGVDARNQVRQTLERYAGVRDVWFVPLDPRSADGAVLAGRPVADLAPRSPLAAAVRRIVGEAVAPAPVAAPARRRGRDAAGRRPAGT